MRIGRCERKTGETDIAVSINLDGSGSSSVESGVPFFDHMLALFARHGLFNLTLTCRGDVEVDDHHSIEDIGIAMGTAFAEANADKSGITRYATEFLPMDEALVRVSVDISGRPFLVYNVDFQTERSGEFEVCLMEEFLRGFAFAAGITLHIGLEYGKNSHHILEAIMKGLGRALCRAAAKDPRVIGVPSTKGVL